LDPGDNRRDDPDDQESHDDQHDANYMAPLVKREPDAACSCFEVVAAVAYSGNRRIDEVAHRTGHQSFLHLRRVYRQTLLGLTVEHTVE
jgi:hypothetical protein